MKKRCEWVGNDLLYISYHDEEWGVPLYDDNKLFEMLILEGAQAGLNWITILRKRKNYEQAFDNFDPQKVAHYDEAKIKTLLSDPGIIRNRLKVRATVKNAQIFLKIKQEYGSFSSYIWQFVGGKQKINYWKNIKEIPAKTIESDSMSKDLKKRGMSFVGSTICYAFMQATGMVNDHIITCFRYKK